MQESHGNRGVIQMQVRQDGGNFERMGEIGVAGCTGLGTVLLHGVHIGLVEQAFVRIRIISGNSFYEFVLAHHGRNRLT